MRYVLALATALVMAATTMGSASALTPAEKLEKDLEALSSGANAVSDTLTFKLETWQQCKSGTLTGSVCAAAKVDCKLFVETFGKLRAITLKMDERLAAATDVPRDEVAHQKLGVDLFKELTELIAKSMTDDKCTST